MQWIPLSEPLRGDGGLREPANLWHQIARIDCPNGWAMGCILEKTDCIISTRPQWVVTRTLRNAGFIIVLNEGHYQNISIFIMFISYFCICSLKNLTCSPYIYIYIWIWKGRKQFVFLFINNPSRHIMHTFIRVLSILGTEQSGQHFAKNTFILIFLNDFDSNFT